MKKIIITLTMVLIAAIAFGQTIGSAPTVENVTMEQNGGTVTVTYDLSYAVNSTYSYITLVISNDGGTSFKISPQAEYLDGDVGMGVEVGEGKQITWRINDQYNAHGDQGLNGATFRARVIAKRDDNYDPETYNPGDPANSVPSGMVLVDGDLFNSDVTIDPFYISQFEVTQDEWTSVMGGIYNPNWIALYGLGANYPAYYVSWFDILEYCNRRSMIEGLTPCYSYTVGETEYGTNPDDWPSGWNTSDANHTNVSCNWTAEGYRLPTEAEWNHAANAAEHPAPSTYSGSNTIGDVAWYRDNAYDVGSGHPDYGTHPVGTKLPNGLGIYDMSGNVYEWCWDIYSDTFPSGGDNPRGATTGICRVLRGGSWYNVAYGCRVDYRIIINATNRSCNCGFRVSRTIN